VAAIDRDIVLADRADLASRPVRSADEAAAALERLRASGSDPAAIKRRRSGRTGGFGGAPDSGDLPGHGSDGAAPPDPTDLDSSFDHDLP
jgi:hypothetical protein